MSESTDRAGHVIAVLQAFIGSFVTVIAGSSEYRGWLRLDQNDWTTKWVVWRKGMGFSYELTFSAPSVSRILISNIKGGEEDEMCIWIYTEEQT